MLFRTCFPLFYRQKACKRHSKTALAGANTAWRRDCPPGREKQMLSGKAQTPADGAEKAAERAKNRHASFFLLIYNV